MAGGRLRRKLIVSNGKVNTRVAPLASFPGSISSQVTRFEEAYRLPLWIARDLLAKCLYRCKDWSDLDARLRSDSADRHARLLSSLPDSDEAREYLEANLHSIARSVSVEIVAGKNLLELYRATRFVLLGIDEEVSLSAAVPKLPPLKWNSANIGPDAKAVLYAAALVNGAPFRLVATRVYLPEYFVFDEPLKHDPRLAEPIGEKLHITWYNPQAWRNAAWAYISLPEDDFESELSLPDEELDDSMKRHAEWFAKSIELRNRGGFYTDEEDERVIPLVIEGETYVVLGFPCDHALSARGENLDVRLQTAESAGCELVTLMSQPLCLEWYRSGDELAGMACHEQAVDIMCTVFTHPDCSLVALQTEFPAHFLHVRPATGFDIRHGLSVEPTALLDEDVFVLEPGNLNFAERIIQEIAAKRVFSDMGDCEERTYFLDIKRPNLTSVRDTRLGLRVIGNEEESGYNLSIETIVLGQGEHRRAYLHIHPALLSLVQVLGPKRVMASIKHGLIIRREKGFRKKLNRAPAWAHRLPATTPSIKETFREAYSRIGDIGFF